MVPPWVPDVNPETDDLQLDNDKSPATEPSVPPSLAPQGRFKPARSSLNKYASEGGSSNRDGGLKHYVKRGYGGSKGATKRMGGTVLKAGALYSALLPGNQNPLTETGGPLDPVLISGRSADEIMDAIVEAVSPIDGTLDAESSRASIKDALSEVLDENPQADLMQLSGEQRELAIMHFMAGDVFRRIDLDLGKDIRESAPNASTGMKRLKEVKDYVKQTIFASFRKIKESGQAISSKTINNIAKNTIRDTFEIFEAYGS